MEVLSCSNKYTVPWNFVQNELLEQLKFQKSSLVISVLRHGRFLPYFVPRFLDCSYSNHSWIRHDVNNGRSALTFGKRRLAVSPSLGQRAPGIAATIEKLVSRYATVSSRKAAMRRGHDVIAENSRVLGHGGSLLLVYYLLFIRGTARVTSWLSDPYLIMPFSRESLGNSSHHDLRARNFDRFFFDVLPWSLERAALCRTILMLGLLSLDRLREIHGFNPFVSQGRMNTPLSLILLLLYLNRNFSKSKKETSCSDNLLRVSYVDMIYKSSVKNIIKIVQGIIYERVYIIGITTDMWTNCFVQ